MKRTLLFLPLLLVTCFAQIQEDPGDIAQAYLRAHELAQQCPYPAFVSRVAGTGSMWPVLDEGCFIVVAQKPWALFRVGDIGNFKRKARGLVPAAGVLHRAIGKSRHGFILQGDNNQRPDSWFFGERDYQGYVHAIVRFAHIPHKKPISYAEWKRQVSR